MIECEGRCCTEKTTTAVRVNSKYNATAVTSAAIATVVTVFLRKIANVVSR